MSSPSSVASKPVTAPPAWLGALFGGKLPPEGGELMVDGTSYVRSDGVLRARGLLLSPAQGNTERSFSYLWSGRDRFRGDGHLATLGEWYRSMYGDAPAASWGRDYV